MLRQEITTAVRNLLGWGKKQYGDAMCFLTITFRNKEDVVTEERYVITLIRTQMPIKLFHDVAFWLVMRRGFSINTNPFLTVTINVWTGAFPRLERLSFPVSVFIRAIPSTHST